MTRYELPYYIGKDHSNWKGDNVSYCGLHAWVKRWKGKAKKCEKCSTKTAKKYEWANKSHRYLRNLTDWTSLCVPCHSKYDKRSEKLKARWKNQYGQASTFKKIEKICQLCKSVFFILPCFVNRKFCSRQCVYRANRPPSQIGNRWSHTEETKLKMRGKRHATKN